MGPAVMPSGGLLVRALYSWRRRLCAVLEAIVVGFLLIYAFVRKTDVRVWCKGWIVVEVRVKVGGVERQPCPTFGL